MKYFEFWHLFILNVVNSESVSVYLVPRISCHRPIPVCILYLFLFGKESPARIYIHGPKVKFNRSKNSWRWTFLNNFITEIEIESGTVCLAREDRSIFSWNVKVSYQTVIAQDNCGNYVVGRKLNVGKSMNWKWINWKWMCFALIS